MNHNLTPGLDEAWAKLTRDNPEPYKCYPHNQKECLKLRNKGEKISCLNCRERCKELQAKYDTLKASHTKLLKTGKSMFHLVEIADTESVEAHQQALAEADKIGE